VITNDQPAAAVAPATTATVKQRPKRDARDLVVRYGFIVVTIGFFLYFSIHLEAFRMSSTMFSMLKYTSVVAIAGLGVTTTMVVGGLDLSVGATAGMSVTVAAMTMVIYAQQGGVAIVAVLLAGAAIGAVNALLIVVLKIPDLLSTLAVMFLVQGLKLVPVDGQSVSSGLILRDGTVAPGKFTKGFLEINKGELGPVPYPVIIWGVLAVATWFLLSRTKWGRVMYAIGSNPEAARLAGLPAQRTLLAAYILCGALSGLAGFMFLARFGNITVVAAQGMELQVVAAVVVGGVNIFGGSGTMIGALFGSVLINLLEQSLIRLPQISQFWLNALLGLLILIAIATDAVILNRLRTLWTRSEVQTTGTKGKLAGSHQ